MPEDVANQVAQPVEAPPTPTPPPPTATKAGPGQRVAHRLLGTAKTATGLLALLVMAATTVAGLLANFLIVLLLATACIKLLTRLVALFRRNLHFGLWRGPLAAPSRPYLVQACFRSALWVVAGVCVTVAVIPLQFSPGEWAATQLLLWGAVAALCVLEWTPRRKLSRVPNVFYGLVLAFLVLQLFKIYLPVDPDHAVVLSPPFKGTWFTFHGGNSPLINLHYYAGSQRRAMDLLLPEDVKPAERNGTDPRAYRTFGQPILSPADGVVAEAENGAEDQRIGASDVARPAGNHVIIRLGSGAYVMLAHLQKGSVTVRKGDAVKTGQQLGLCGNSGNTSQPHLHIQAMTGTEIFAPDNEPIPMLFLVPGQDRPRSFKRNDLITAP